MTGFEKITACTAAVLISLSVCTVQAFSRSDSRGRRMEGFSISEIPDSVFSLMRGRSYKADCTIPLSELRYVKALYKDAQGITHRGEMVVSGLIADDILEILEELYRAGYPIERMQLIDDFDADDEKSMKANNSSAFNFRKIAGSDRLSRHSTGMAIDINPLHNPYYKKLDSGKEIIQPEGARKYLDRTLEDPYMIKEGDLCWKLFTSHGFEWGGSWKSLKDYQHFEKK